MTSAIEPDDDSTTSAFFRSAHEMKTVVIESILNSSSKPMQILHTQGIAAKAAMATLSTIVTYLLKPNHDFNSIGNNILAKYS